jgi:hypothetical protein
MNRSPERPLKIAALFIDHPASVGETYAQHFRTATRFSISMIAGGLACLLHALFPFLFVTTASRAIVRLHARMVVGRERLAGRDCSESDNVRSASNDASASTPRRTAS